MLGVISVVPRCSGIRIPRGSTSEYGSANSALGESLSICNVKVRSHH